MVIFSLMGFKPWLLQSFNHCRLLSDSCFGEERNTEHFVTNGPSSFAGLGFLRAQTLALNPEGRPTESPRISQKYLRVCCCL